MPEKPNRPTPPTRPSGRPMLWWVVIPLLVLLGLTLLNKTWEDRREISATEFWRYAQNKQLEDRVTVSEKEITGTLAASAQGLPPGASRKFRVTYTYAADPNFDTKLRAALGDSAEIYYETGSWWTGPLTQMLFFVGLFLLLWFFLFRRIGAAASGGGFLGGFARSKHRTANKETSRTTFADVAGINEAKEEVTEIIEFLKNPRRFQRLGGRVPRGVLLVGEPGCGKTLLARAIAGEANVPFMSISGSDFVEMFVGVGASRVRDLFRQAKESAPCIIFLDEIDAVGRRRGVGFNGGGHDEREQTLNAILVEMDGFDSSDQVIVIAATNRADVLDPALTRPGRFDRQIDVPLPDLQGRYHILKIYADKVKTGPDVDLQRLARGTPMFSGADLAALVNEAAIAATMQNKEFIEQADMEEARDKVRWGRARKSRVIDEKEKEITAYHEAGHALIQVLTPNSDPLHKVSIIPRGQAGGATFSLPEKDRYLYTRNYCEAMLQVCLGGRLAEQISCNDISSGAAADIAQATQIARKMVLDWGMSDKLGFIRYAAADSQPMMQLTKDYSDKTAEMIDLEIKAIVDHALEATREILESHKPQLQAVAEALLKYETLNADDVQAIIDGKKLDKPTVTDLLTRETEKLGKGTPGVTLSPPVEPSDETPPLPEPS